MNATTLTWPIAAALLVLGACGTDEAADAVPDSDRVSHDGSVADVSTANNVLDMGGGGPDVATPDIGKDTGQTMGSCNRAPRPANGPRKVVVAHPFTGTQFEVFDLDAQGGLTRPNVSFAMGESHEAEIQFTPDGEVGYAVQEGGTLGVFRFNASGQPEVLAAAHDPGFYVSGALIDPAGDNLYAWEEGWRKTDDGMYHGALYRLPLSCATGLPGDAVEVLRGKLMRAAAWLTPARMAVAAVDLLDDETPNDAHLIEIDGPTRVASVSVFPDDEAIAAGFGVTRDGLYMLVGDNSAFSGIPNRIGVAGIQGDELFGQQVIDIPDPVKIFTSPYDNAAIVLSTTNDNIYVLSYNPGAAVSAFGAPAPLVTTDAVLLPLGAAMITRGDLDGLVVIGENVGVRRVRFEPDGSVTDLGLLELGTGSESITGALGVQP